MSIRDDVEELKFCIKVGERPSNDVFERCIDALNKIAVFDQILWERDRAMEQLEANGLRFGHKDDYGWISCKERMPEDDEAYKDKKIINCLVTTDKGIVTKVQRSKYGDKWYWGRIRREMKAWRPLPSKFVDK